MSELGCGDVHHRLANFFDTFQRDGLAAQEVFCRRHSGGRKAEHAQINASVAAGMRVVHRELHRDAGAGVNRSATFQRDISSATASGR